MEKQTKTNEKEFPMEQVNESITSYSATDLPTLDQINVPSISKSAVLVELKTSCWDGKVTDKDISNKVAADNNAEKKAGDYKKHLFAGNKLLREIHTIKGEARNHVHYTYTMPWIDRGPRLCAQAVFPEYIERMNEKIAKFDPLVAEFLDSYDFYRAEQQSVLGDMYKEHEYPSRQTIANKFSLQVNTYPLASSDDFRLDINTQALQVVKEGYDKFIQETYVTGMNKVLGELRQYLENMAERLGPTPDGTKGIFRDTLTDNVLKTVKLVRMCNVINDLQITALCDRLENELLRVTPEALRDDSYLRAQTQTMTQQVIANLPSLDL
jgi:hypothetical protein